MAMYITDKRAGDSIRVPEETLRRLKIRPHKGWANLDFELNPNQVEKVLKEIGAM